MPIDPSIIGELKSVPIQTPDPLKVITAAAQLQDVQAQAEQRRLAGEKARQQAMDEAAVRRVLASTGGDVEAALPQLRQIAPKAALEFETEIGKARTAHLEAMGKGLENQKKQLDHLFQVWGLVKDQPSLEAIRPLFVKTFPDLDATLPTEYGDGSAVQRVSDAALSRKDQLEQKQNLVKLFAEGKVNEAVGQALSTTTTPEEWHSYLAGAKALGAPPEILAAYGEWAPDAPARAAQRAISPAKRAELAGQAETRAQTAANQAAAREQAAHSPAYKEWQDYQAQGGTLDFDAYMTKDANRKAARITVTGQGGPEDVKDAVQGMIDGRVPPMLPGRASTAYTAMLAEAQRRGYNLAGAATDWTATQKHIATMNGAQQLRLNQAVNALPEMLDQVDTLAQQWKGTGAPLLNRANLALAKNGVYGTKAATVATQLDAQIADVVADLGNVYMGGNSPTDHALALAQKSLQADWSEPVLRQMITLAKQNVQIRRNSINNTGVAGASAENPYAPAPAAAPAPTPGATGGGAALTYQDYLRSRGGR